MQRSLGLLGLLVLTACAAKGEDAASSESAVEASLLDEAPGANAFVLTQRGSGNVPIGSGCAPGDESYTVDMVGGRFIMVRCQGAPLRSIGYHATLTPAQIATFGTALSNLRPATTQGCPNREFMTLAAWQDARFLKQWTDACLDGALVAARAIAVNATTSAGAITLLPVGTPLWNDFINDLEIQESGHGETPIGSQCVRDASEWSFVRATDGVHDWSVRHRTCVANASGLFEWSYQQRQFAFADLTALLTALGQSQRVLTGTCDAGATFTKLQTSQPGLFRGYAAETSICAESDINLQPMSNVPAILSALRALPLPIGL